MRIELKKKFKFLDFLSFLIENDLQCQKMTIFGQNAKPNKSKIKTPYIIKYKV